MAWMDPKESLIETLNLGDSGVLIVRPSKEDNKLFNIMFRSKEQQYRFNHPYQCGTNYKPPTNADVHAHIVEDNDVVILATDGVLDNLFNEDIMMCLNKAYDKRMSDKATSSEAQASNCLARTAEQLSYRKDYDSPFAKNAREAGRNHPGGKPDDITVIVA